MNVLMLLTNPFIHDNRVFLETQVLLAAGHRVALIGWDRAGRYPSRERVDGVDVRRIANPLLIRLLRRRQAQIHFFWRRAGQEAARLAFDVVHCHDLDTLPVGLRLKTATGCRLVYDAHDIYTYILRRDWSRVLAGYYRRIERRAANAVDALIVADDGYRAYFRAAGYADGVTVMNCKPLADRCYQPPANSIFTLVYAGGLYRPRRVLQTAEVVIGMPGVRLVVAGAGPQAGRLAEIARRHEQIAYLGQQPQHEVIPLLRSADAVVRWFDPADCNLRLGTSNLQFGAMVAGRPLIAAAGTRTAEIVMQEQCGLAVEDTPAGLRRAIARLRDDPALCRRLGENALRAAVERYNWERESAKLTGLYARLEG